MINIECLTINNRNTKSVWDTHHGQPKYHVRNDGTLNWFLRSSSDGNNKGHTSRGNKRLSKSVHIIDTFEQN